IEPPAPPMFSTMNDCPSARPSSPPMVRPVRSRPPPGWAGTMIFTGFEGYACAAASAGSTADARRSEAAKRTIMTVLGDERKSLLGLRARFTDHFRPFGRFRLDISSERLRRAADRFCALTREPLDHIRRARHGDNVAIELHDQRLRRAGRHHYAMPGRRFESRQGRL